MFRPDLQVVRVKELYMLPWHFKPVKQREGRRAVEARADEGRFSGKCDVLLVPSP